MSCASSSSLKEKEIQKKKNIKSRKIDKRKRKMLMSKAFHNRYIDESKILLAVCKESVMMIIFLIWGNSID